jgi:hypothetical protein
VKIGKKLTMAFTAFALFFAFAGIIAVLNLRTSAPWRKIRTSV